MKTFIATVCLLAVISLPAAAESPENRTEQDTLKTRIYEGSVSVGVTYIINLGIRTTHGVRYLDKNLFLGGELWARKGFMEPFTLRAGFLSRWYFVANKNIDTYLGCAAGLTTGSTAYHNPYGEWLDVFEIGAYLTPEIGIGIRLRNGDYIDFALDFPLWLWFFDRTFTDDVLTHNDGQSYFDYRPYPGIIIGYRF